MGYFFPREALPDCETYRYWMKISKNVDSQGQVKSSPAGLKCPPDVLAQVMMAKAIPRPKANPIGNIPPNVLTPSSSPKPFVVDSVKAHTAAIPGKT